MMKWKRYILQALMIAGFSLISVNLFAQGTEGETAVSSGVSLGLVLGVLGAAAATFLGGIGSSLGLKYSGQAASGVLSEDPTKFGVIFPIQALPGSQGIFGLLMGFLILVKIGALGAALEPMTVERGLYALMCALPVGVVGVSSGIGMGQACAASIQLVARKPGEFGKAIISPALIETYAVFGLLMSFIMWLKL
jgi:V/A-type H+-transporting ATPase subunit K